MSEASGQWSRNLAASFGERRGRSVSQVVEDDLGISKGLFHTLLAVAAVIFGARRRKR